MPQAMAERTFELMGTLEQLATRTVMQRLAAYLIDQQREGAVSLTQEALAAELGTAREVEFRALAGLGRLGLIEKRRGIVRIVDEEGLARLL